MIALLALLLSAPATSSPHFEREWSENRATYEQHGVSRDQARVAFFWGEAQYYVGRCARYLSVEDAIYWRDWLSNTNLRDTSLYPVLAGVGRDMYDQGLADTRKRPISRELCARTIRDWRRDMEAAVR